MSYTRGTKVEVSATVTYEDDGSPYSGAEEVVLTVQDPTGAVTVQRLSDGEVLPSLSAPNRYEATVDTMAAAGTWHYQFEVPGAEATTERRQFTVKERLPAVV